MSERGDIVPFINPLYRRERIMKCFGPNTASP